MYVLTLVYYTIDQYILCIGERMAVLTIAKTIFTVFFFVVCQMFIFSFLYVLTVFIYVVNYTAKYLASVDSAYCFTP